MKTVVVAGHSPVDEDEISIMTFLSFKNHPFFIIGNDRANVGGCWGGMFSRLLSARIKSNIECNS